MKILAFDTSNKPLTVAVVEDGKILARADSTEEKTHSVSLLPDIKDSLQKAGLSIDDIDRIAVAQGPGSYTGVRIAVTVAKTLAFTLDKPLVGISSLRLLAANGDDGKLVVPVEDARNDNAFAGAYLKKSGEVVDVIKDQHIKMDDLFKLLANYQADQIQFVNVSEHLADLITEKLPKATITLTKDSLPDAAKLAALAENEEPVKDINAFVPTYLRLTQAEHDWIKKGHKEDGNISYVEEI
ncbi:tRNA (adenosine(37)-N6)-threonylcarbamoyltransferase complex dimerization subunit type 1 TsaB [Companilactobacillus sp.]|jgi:tRNA threonylcarbamoyl adenosine modification protein YeaZ|uniref:tRNA (adenosine(37)-N6)-threonylcarbamoyltransferase complex dimerization subunit type 1 TsaB n=1 Tax=Companilactobacillus sp. TaxID=2767905 RepID=UPI0025BCC028|nr:tRNA (adenosine(37)-N6)-threonylcarbamoyltransferase complex dimerization subunit type 1 TsaB [Companilactobacillus sp.]MCH4010263.1 tRNA (adenosine(37)-N6)-threonylcarbamoyltransferase complex dimerization subunit type 1 TsaB [Companilactobacillus sp.]MCH4052061.1 tRNA (adenosine(37)-N6)-threonylcarbamoyltransferase complex dimerization subunit type 1 TsaB [Companilactobacillus sp.]MCH4078205.1 tRNA (adenosine(37)-N6)-threonylcarbamoyltransferase complex dimerization subunit type 1 TsaB [Com